MAVNSIIHLLAALDEREVALRVGIRHLTARAQYPVQQVTVSSFPEYKDALAAYYNYHFTQCISGGGQLRVAEAYSRAKLIIENKYHQQGLDLSAAYHDATQGGLGDQFTLIAKAMKSEAEELYMIEVFDRYVDPNCFESKVEIMRQFFQFCAAPHGNEMQPDRPEQYAKEYQDVIRLYLASRRQMSGRFRR